jgi:hypothetical protein
MSLLKTTPSTLLILLLISISCKTQNVQKEDNKQTSGHAHKLNLTLDPYWYDGKAELNSFNLSQVRYGETRKGEAVLIFVTEDFSRKNQVKLDNPDSAGEDRQPVLKMNFTKRFQTGVYPYNMLLSTFQPIGQDVLQYPLKTNANITEWCGQTFAQLNQKSDSFRFRGFSYFESEGEVDKNLELTWTEDGLWNLIRINPEKLPTGKIKIIPGLFYTLLKHKPFIAMDAIAQLEENDLGVKTYTLRYEKAERTLSIRFVASSPFPILSWTETYREGNQIMTTTADLKKRIKLDYWNHNTNADSIWRKELEIQD